MSIAQNPELDQHFLNDSSAIAEIIKALTIKKQDIIVEIGAGNGALTKNITKCKLIAIELDNRFADELKQQNLKNVEIIQGNALELISKLQFNKIISSTPYSICEPLTYKLFELNFDKAVLIFPEGFVKTLVEEDGKLKLFAKEFLKIKQIRKLDRSLFTPKPRVDSVAIAITKTKKQSLLKQLYLQRDKKLKNALRESLVILKHLTKRQAKDKADALIAKFKLNSLENKKIQAFSIEDYTAIKPILVSE